MCLNGTFTVGLLHHSVAEQLRTISAHTSDKTDSDGDRLWVRVRVERKNWNIPSPVPFLSNLLFSHSFLHQSSNCHLTNLFLPLPPLPISRPFLSPSPFFPHLLPSSGPALKIKLWGSKEHCKFPAGLGGARKRNSVGAFWVKNHTAPDSLPFHTCEIIQRSCAVGAMTDAGHCGGHSPHGFLTLGATIYFVSAYMYS